MQPSARKLLDGPFPSQGEDPKAEIDYLEDRKRFDYWIKIRCEEVPEDLGPKESFERSRNLVYSSSVHSVSVPRMPLPYMLLRSGLSTLRGDS